MERLLLLIACIITFPTLIYAVGMLSASTANVDAMLKNPVVVQRQIRCLQCKGPCDRIGAELKRVIPHIAATQCRDCTSTERLNMGKIVNHAQTYYPREWAELNASMRSGRRC